MGSGAYTRPMDINVLVIGVGNSRVHAGVFVQGELRHVRHLSHEQRDDWVAMIGEIWSEVAHITTADVAGCCVVPELVEPIERAVREATSQEIQWVGSDIRLPITVTTDEPEKTGVDRVLVTAAAFEQLGKACVVVDAGTALTINLCNDKGALVGGAIAPGAGLMLRSLNEHTAKLPAIAYETPTSDYGTNTTDAMQHGVSGAIRGLVQSMAERWAEQTGTWPEVIATGGDARALFTDWEIVHAISDDLLLYGIALAYTENG